MGRVVTDTSTIAGMLDDPIPLVRLATVQVLWSWNQPELLMQALVNADASVRNLAKDALLAMGTPALKPLYEALRCDDARLQNVAARILFEMEVAQDHVPDTNEDIELEEDVDPEPDSSRYIALSHAIHTFSEENNWVGYLQFIDEMGDIGDESTVKYLCSAFLHDDDYIQDAALQAIRALLYRYPYIFPTLPANIRLNLSDPFGQTTGKVKRDERKGSTGQVTRTDKNENTKDIIPRHSSLHGKRTSAEATSLSHCTPGFTIPEPPVVPKGLALDMERVQQKMTETQVVSNLLGSIFQEEVAVVPVVVVPPTALAFKDLDTPHFVFLNMMIARGAWTRAEVEGIATPLGLMTDGAMERINEIALEARNEFAFEGDDPIEVNVGLIKEMLR